MYLRATLNIKKNTYVAMLKGDIIDMGFASVAVPYCDIVITEKYLAHIVNNDLKLANKFNTHVLNLNDGIVFLDKIPYKK
jgi:hypothetical protein